MLPLALVLDAVIGEPEPLWKRVPHPVVLMGRLVTMLDEGLNDGSYRRLRGVAALLILIGVCIAPALLLSTSLFGGVPDVIIAAILLAQRSLVDHVLAVASALSRSVEEGRVAVAHIVGRDPGGLDEPAVARAAVESAAENFSDGVVAPAFWFLVAGLPGIVLYKAVNTADSMIGHRTPRHEQFGWAAARLDDLLNLVPARLAGLLIAGVGGGRAAIDVMVRDAWLHRSPNAGWPEAAMAASLGLALAGPRYYAGALTDDPYLNPQGRSEATPADIRSAVEILWRAWAVLLGITAALWALGWIWGAVFG
ncbi:MAG: adenosylcobinamide-phosphate synthase CbiB [Pseudomonadota bacterium]